MRDRFFLEPREFWLNAEPKGDGSKKLIRKSDYPNRSPCWPRPLTTPSCEGELGAGRNLNHGSQAMGSQVLRPAVFPDVFLKKHLKKGALKGVEHLDRLVNDVLVRQSICLLRI